MNIDDIEKGNNYSYKDLYDMLKPEDGYSVQEYGTFLVGEKFIVIKDNEEAVISFLMTGYSDINGAVFTCIYKDE